MSQEIAVIASVPPAPPLDEAAGPSTSSSSSGGASSTSLGLVEREYVIQPNTIIELVDLYVPPVRSEFRIPIFQAPDEALALNTPTPTPTPGIRGRRRGRPPLGTRPSGVTPRKPYKRRPRPETPPPLPPVPNYLAHVINPLENEIYPKVIVQPARLPFVIPKNLNDDPPPPPPPVPAPPPPAPATASIQPQPQPQPQPGGDVSSAKEAAQLRENLKLFGPNVTVSRVTSHGQSRFLAVHKKPNGEQRKIMFSASQLQAFVASGGADQVASGSTLAKPSITRLRPGPSPRPPVTSPASPEQPKRVIVEPPPNFRLPTMAALRAAAQQNARRGGLDGGAAAGSRGGGAMGMGISMDMGLGMGMAGKPQAKAKEQATTKEAPKMGNTSASASAPTPTPTPVPASARALTEAEAMPPPPPRPVPMEMSRSRVPSILTRKSQLRLINERAKRAAEKVGGDAKK